MTVNIVNRTMELADCRENWFFDEAINCWCLEDVIYTPIPKVPAFQRLSIYAPRELMKDGMPTDKAADVPVVFENNSAGYMQMPNTWPDSPRWRGKHYLESGYVYVTCGCSGRDSRNEDGGLVGKGPSTLVDLKTAIRFLRHNRHAVPGNLDKIISVGASAGGAMSSLLGVTGDNERYLPYLKENGAFMDESDAVYAAQIYCPIVDLEHADMAYEWMFHADKTNEASFAGQAETMTPFKDELSALLAEEYIAYFNSLELKDPDTGELLRLNSDGRSGSAYDYLMNCFNASAEKHLGMIAEGKLPVKYSVEEYLEGKYTYLAPAPIPAPDPNAHHVGPGAAMPKPQRPVTLGEMMLRPPKGAPVINMELPLVEYQGAAKQEWLKWDGTHAEISSLDSYVLGNRRRMKPCTAFDSLGMHGGENQLFGTAEADHMHFSPVIGKALAKLKESYPEECARYYDAYAAIASDSALSERVYLCNPMNFIGSNEKSSMAKHFRIRVGSRDADTATTISMSLALKLANAGCGTVDYAIVWDEPHCSADYPGEECSWIAAVCG